MCTTGPGRTTGRRARRPRRRRRTPRRRSRAAPGPAHPGPRRREAGDEVHAQHVEVAAHSLWVACMARSRARAGRRRRRRRSRPFRHHAVAGEPARPARRRAGRPPRSRRWRGCWPAGGPSRRARPRRSSPRDRRRDRASPGRPRASSTVEATATEPVIASGRVVTRSPARPESVPVRARRPARRPRRGGGREHGNGNTPVRRNSGSAWTRPEHAGAERSAGPATAARSRRAGCPGGLSAKSAVSNRGSPR